MCFCFAIRSKRTSDNQDESSITYRKADYPFFSKTTLRGHFFVWFERHTRYPELMGLSVNKKHTSLAIALGLLIGLGANMPRTSTVPGFTKPAQAQYFVRQKTEEEKAAEEGKSDTAAPPVTVIPKKPGNAVTIERRKVNPLYVRKPLTKKQEEEAAQGAAPIMDEIPEEYMPELLKPEDIQIQISTEELLTKLKTSMGDCTKQDKDLISLVQAAMDQAANQSAEYAKTVGEEETFASMSEMDFEGLREEFEKTGEFPEELRDIMKETPKDMIQTFEVLREHVDFEQYAAASMKCADYDTMLKDMTMGSNLISSDSAN